MKGEAIHSSWPGDWETGLRTESVGDLTLILSSIRATDRIYSESTLCWGQSHPLCDRQILIIEDPTDGDISIR